MKQDEATTEPSNRSAAGPLAGVRVVEMGQLIAGPFCGQVLGDLGAEVIKIEEPRAGDPMRQWGQARVEGDSLWWSVLGRNKKSVALNLRDERGQELARQLVATADIVIENFRPGSLEKWGLDYDTLGADNPGLIMVRVSGFGQTGPYATRPGYGSIGEAMGGLRHIVGDPAQPPARVGISVGDSLAGMFAALGALAALHERTRSGRGQIVDASIYESVLGVMEALVPDWTVGGVQRERTGAILPKIAPSNVYPTADGQWVIVAANQDTVFRRLAQAMAEPGLADDERFSTHGARGELQAELDEIVAGFTLRHTAQELIDLLNEHAVPVGKIFRVADMLVDPQYRARESIVEMERPDQGSIHMQNAFPRLSRTDSRIRWTGPPLGRHTDEVLQQAGIAADRLPGLREDGVIR